MNRAFWTGLAIAGAVLLETALAYLVRSPGRYLDPFLLVTVYCALSGGETHGMLAGAAAGWVQDVLFGGRVLGLSPLSKLAVGFGVGLAGGRFLITSAAARALVVLLATVADAVLVQWLASVFSLQAAHLSPLALVGRATLNALAGGLLFALVDRRLDSRP
ncbi:MAG TPA: rod shape-determining protein MreD [Vicinamibacteria bacterium]|nr:rod shape-determining protein MreD [Vicinamibacteria bacterium]